ncbi:hypothetical protein [Vibrio quintilis]|uniref:Uncharacterized protein n=1 Tax=Vibrio quintilis TaxID=1117707 RepID=A0A1M7YQ41_9VIBR|nr:hypothetical protein [Vibrio quintilis]SHO54749.1 hypothetical protein VQ7734_00467 [Vibrio quintilis]
MPIEVKQMTIQSNVTSTPADQTKQETVKPPCPDDGLATLCPHDGEQYQAMKVLFHKLEQDRRER